jgi:Uma2 family endonuclease
MVQFDPTLRLPTARELPDSDETPVDNELQDSVPGVLKAILALLWQNRSDWFFGIDMGIYADTESPWTAIVPDGFLSLGVPRFRPEYGRRGRPSYVLWEEDGILPVFVLEVVSQTYRGEYTEKLRQYQALEVQYYAVYDPEAFQPNHERLEVHQLIDGTYERMSGEPVWMPELGLGLGRAISTVDGWTREWLFWFSEEGERYPVPEEYQRYRADLAEKQVEAEQQARAETERLAEQERQARAEAEQLVAQERQARVEAEQLVAQERQARAEAERQAQALMERLKALGFDPTTF